MDQANAKAKTLILLAHGSRAPETFAEMRDLAAHLGQTHPDLDIHGAFLSLTPPDLTTAVEQAAARGARDVRILPLFLFSGKHVLDDVPDQVQALRKAFPDLSLTLLDPIGRHGRFGAFLLEAAGL